jgi:hypothetical protein
MPPRLCHGLITHNAFSPGHALKGGNLTPEQQACMVAAWWRHCLSWAVEKFDTKNRGSIDIVAGGFWRRVVGPAAKFQDEKCTPEILKIEDRHGQDVLQQHDSFPTDYWNDVHKTYERTKP